jgi:shikimate kinase
MHVKLKGSPAFYLVGFMGCGKTTVGRLLANRLKWDFVDLDEEIEREAEAKIVDIFDKFGEASFRALERKALNRQIRHARMGMARVVALGGGAFAQASNREAMEAAGVSIWLKSPIDQLWDRVSDEDDRPLARDREQFEALYREREPSYAEADFTIERNHAAPDQTVDDIQGLSLL